MKKITLIALFCALFMAPSVNAQEVTYVEDPAQGYLMNRFQDNWFITAEGGAGMMFSSGDKELKFGKRITPTFNVAFGKWFSPIIGLRAGVQMYKEKGATLANGLGITSTAVKNNYFEQKFWSVGPAVDVLVNVTNWWCGYHPGRVYNAIVYGGASTHWTMAKDASDKWKNNGVNLGVQAGLLNTFAVSPQVDLLLDLRANLDQNRPDGSRRKVSVFGQVMAGITYKFKKREWNAPTVPVCPEYKYTDAEGDALVARLQAADAKIASLEQQLKACLNRPAAKATVASVDAPLATIYFPIGVSKVSREGSMIAKAAANAMKESNEKYVVTGYADNYTGGTKINDSLRKARANNIAKILKKAGVASDNLEVTTNNDNLTTFGAKSAPMDRAVTITNAK